MKKPLAVVLLSGGLDSCVSATMASRENELALLHANYGQRTAARERRSFDQIAAHLGVGPERRRVLDLSFLGEFGGSALTDPEIPVPQGPPGEGVPVTYVPFRNANLLCAAVSWAELLDARSIWIGAVEEDSSGYPDCRGEFFQLFENLARMGTSTLPELTIETPLLHMRKREIVEQGQQIGAPLHLSWSCYKDGDYACGCCESCWLRQAGFREAGIDDQIPYRR